MTKILIIGGTLFIGRNVVEQLLTEKEYELTIFNRGLTNPNLFPEVKKIRGDRNTDDVQHIAKEKWDYVIDLACYYPHSLKAILANLSKNVKRYIFVSTCSVYGFPDAGYCDESFPILECTAEEALDETSKTYGKRKSECERILEASGIKYTSLRPALVYGKYDNIDRHYYWLYQVKKRQEILLPDKGKLIASGTYVIDLVKVIKELLSEKEYAKVYNIVTDPQMCILTTVNAASTILNKTPKFLNASSAFLKTNHVKPWSDLPLWASFDFGFEGKKMKEDFDLSFTSFQQSINETIDYFDSQNWPMPKLGLKDDIQNLLIEKLAKE